MFALLKREIQDHLVYFIGAAVISTLFVTIALSIAYNTESKDVLASSVALLIPLTFISALGTAGMGSAQMYTDKNKKISAFISTLTTTRRQILLARILSGLLVILLLLAPVAIAFQVLIHLLAPPIPLYAGIVRDVFVAGLLMSFACYCLGLQTGFTSNKLTPTLGALGLSLILLPLLLIKGFGLHIITILLAFIVCSLIRTWNRFMSAPLV
jgi:hypothetical protein